MNARITELRELALRSHYEGDPAHDQLRHEALAATEGEPTVLREAKAQAHYNRRRPVAIADYELVVGGRVGLQHAAEPVTQATFGRCHWRSPWRTTPLAESLFRGGMLSPAGNHTTVDYDTIFAIGFEGIISHLRTRRAALVDTEPSTAAKRDFLTALEIVAQGYIVLCRRYGDLAAEQARTSPSEARRQELLHIAAHCRRVPAQPPRTFWEACQCAWFAFMFCADAPGRVDQFLYPFYARDLAAGTLTPEFARELLSCLWIKYFEWVGAGSGVSAHNHLTLGGVKPDGSDASNDLTGLCLDVTEDLCLQRPQVGLRWHPGTPMPLMQRAVRVLRNHTGNPDFCSDAQIVPALEKIGVATADARDFSLSGCHEVIVSGKAQMGSVEGFINMPKLLRLALGLEPDLWPGVAPAAIASEADLWQAVEGAMAQVVKGAHEVSLDRDRAAAKEPGGNLAASLVVSDCIENCRGYTQGGARYNFCNWDVIGVANLADALAAVRILVFEEKTVTLERLVAILAANWDGEETLRQRVLNRLPHFGNQEAATDQLARRVIERLAALFQQYTPFRGGCYILGTTAGGENLHVEFGRVTGATPDGRKAGEPVADSIGAAQGRDRNGVTALLASVATLPHRLLPTATTLNVRLDPRLLDSDPGVEAVAALIDRHFRDGGQQCQFNLVDRDTLLDAKAHPERHGDLMVRVAGYSAPFTSLWPDLQDEIIARTEHTVAR